MARKIAVNVLAALAAISVIGLLGTADAVDQGAISLWQDLWQTTLFIALAFVFGLGAWALNRRG